VQTTNRDGSCALLLTSGQIARCCLPASIGPILLNSEQSVRCFSPLTRMTHTDDQTDGPLSFRYTNDSVLHLLGAKRRALCRTAPPLPWVGPSFSWSKAQSAAAPTSPGGITVAPSVRWRTTAGLKRSLAVRKVLAAVRRIRQLLGWMGGDVSMGDPSKPRDEIELISSSTRQEDMVANATMPQYHQTEPAPDSRSTGTPRPGRLPRRSPTPSTVSVWLPP
jgi:hypothetical protein